MTAAVPDALYETVLAAWRETLSDASAPRDQSWAEAGADSLKAVHLILRLERALGRKISFDILSREMTPASLASSIAEEAPTAADQDRPTVFLIPGIYGDEPKLAEFRGALRDTIGFELIGLPDLDKPAAQISDMVASGRAAAETIAKRQPVGTIMVAGFSFGASLAFETAQQLIKMGRRVGWVGLLDPGLASDLDLQSGAESPGTAFSAAAWKLPPLTRSRLRPRVGESWSHYIRRGLIALAVRAGAIEIARRTALAWADRHDPLTKWERERYVLTPCRGRALLGWRPQPLGVPILLVASEESIALWGVEKWRSLCSKLDIVTLPGVHNDLFSPSSLTILAPAFRDAVAKAAAGNPSP